MRYRMIGVGLALTLVVCLAGCGGGGHATRSRVQLLLGVAWPDRTRAVPGNVEGPESAESVVVVLAGAAPGGGDIIATGRRPDSDIGCTSTLWCDAAPRPGAWQLTAHFYSQPGGIGAAVAQASVRVRVASDGIICREDGSDINAITAGEAIASVTVTPDQVFRVGHAQELQYTAADANGNLIATGLRAAQISVSMGAGELRVDTDNRLVGVMPGSAVISVAIDHVTSAWANARVVTDSALTISPSYADITPSETLQFYAATGDGTRTGIVWSVQEGAAGGTIDGFGTYTAPSAAGGPYHVIAAEQGNPSHTVVATVLVRPASLLVAGYSGQIASFQGLNGAHAAVSPPIAQVAHAMAVDATGRLYLADPVGHCIVRVDDPAGSNPVRFGASGSGQGQFMGPSGIALDSRNRIYVADSGNDRIVRFDDMSGSNWTVLGSEGRGAMQFRGPGGIAIDSADRIYVCDADNWRAVRVDDMAGRNWTTLRVMGSSGGTEFQPDAACIGPDGKLYLAGLGDECIVRVDDFARGRVASFGVMGFLPGQFQWPTGIQVDRLGRIYVADYVSWRITRFDNMNGDHPTVFDVGRIQGNGGAPWALIVR